MAASRKFYLSPVIYGSVLAESIAQAMEAERPPNAGYQIAVGPREAMGPEWEPYAEEKTALEAREAAIAQAKGWSPPPVTSDQQKAAGTPAPSAGKALPPPVSPPSS